MVFSVDDDLGSAAWRLAAGQCVAPFLLEQVADLALGLGPEDVERVRLPRRRGRRPAGRSRRPVARSVRDDQRPASGKGRERRHGRHDVAPRVAA
jgi:hypothetical protein